MQNLHAELAQGPIPFERFMEIALYEPGGFFHGDVVRSTATGDFLTSPEVSPRFGETLARFVAAERERVGEPFTLVEVGAGSGSLLRPLLAALPGIDAWAVEVSPPARAALARVIPAERVVTGLGRVPLSKGVIVANELLDNLPMAIARRTAEGWMEQWVGLDGRQLAFVAVPVRPAVEDWLEKYAGPVAVGDWIEVELEAQRWLLEALNKLEAGAVVAIDYGDLAQNLASRRREGTLRTYQRHHLGPPPLHEPGASDITADVNFSALLEVAMRAGAEVSLVRQDDFLTEWGLRAAISDLKRREWELTREGNERERLVVRSQRTDAETTLHPRGLGDFRVLVARKGH